jgi:dipeptidase E
MELHLFSTPGREDIRYVLEAARPFLEGKDEPLVAYLPAASLSNAWLEYTEKAFKGLARIGSIDTEMMSLTQMEALLRKANLVYIPGGNTFLLNHRLHLSKVFDFLRKKALAGMPLIGVSAGTVLCGRNILTSNDMNMAETGFIEGLNLTPFNFSVHYPDDLISRANRDEWLLDYHVFHDNPVLLMADDAYVRVDGKKVLLERGDAWILRKGEEKEKLVEGKVIKA